MRKLLSLLAAMLIMVSCSNSGTDIKPEAQLRFKDGKFKIAQFTDMHFGRVDSVAVRKMIENTVAEEQPDLIVLTGDIVTDATDLSDARKMWQQVIGILENTNTPYAIVMGNHDAESCDEINADTLETWLPAMAPHCLNYPTTSNCYGHGNKTLPILSETSDKAAALVYVIDSNDYPADSIKMYSDYDWIHPDQIKWYVDESEHYKAQNGGQPLPALAYFHICLPEYDAVGQDANRFGSFSEHTCPGQINTGFFSAAFFQGDIMGTFVGHDHSNDYIGIHKGIALGYGRLSGVQQDAPNLLIGSRIVELTEGKREFTTWIRTIEGTTESWHYPTGINSGMEKEMLPAQNIEADGNGVRFTYYEGIGKSLAAVLTKANEKTEGTMPNFDITKAPAEDHFGYHFDTWFLSENDDVYYFRLASDDGATLKIDGKLIIDNDGSHSSNYVKRYVALAKGFHHLEVDYFEDYMGQLLKIAIASKTMAEQPIPDNLLYLKK